MHEHNGHCLFEKWQTTSLPPLPTNGFWPSFSEAAIGEFLVGKTAEPVQNRGLEVDGARTAQSKIQAFVAEVESLDEADYPCKELYLDFERERVAIFEMIVQPGDKHKQATLNDQIYGPLSEMHHDAALSHLATHLDEAEPAGAGATAAISAVLEAWSDVPRGQTVTDEFEKLNAHRKALRPYVARHFDFVDNLLEPYADSPSLTSEQLALVLDETVGQVLGDERRGWRAITAAGVPNVFVNLHERAVTIPAGRTYSAEHAKTLAVHEVGVHVRRAYNGAASREPLAGLGMPGYGPTEEAFGVLLGNAYKTTYHQINSLIPFAVIAYASRPEAPSFREVHTFAMNLIISLANPDEATLIARRSEFARAAFSRSIRVLRLGRPGVLERSTTKYWYGQLLISRYLDERGVSDATIEEFLLGKYDCLNPTHLTLIKHHAAAIH